MSISVPSENSVNAALRHIGTATGTATGIFVVLGFLSPEQSASIIQAMHDVTAGLQQAFGGFSKIALIAGPVFAAWMATMASRSATVKSQISSILNATKSSSSVTAEDAKQQLVAATATLPEVDNKKLAEAVETPLVAAAVTPEKIVKP
jgi:hypothetical protein